MNFVHRISIVDFAKTFTHLEIVHLDSEISAEEPSLQRKNSWQVNIHRGSWRKGVTAGGCRNNPGMVGITLTKTKIIIRV